MLLVYIASGYSQGDPVENVQRQVEMAHTLLDWGYCPVWPLSSHYLELYRSRPYDEWMEMDFALLSRCDALLKLEGESVGADLEVREATRMGIPVAYSITELQRVVRE